MYQEGKKHTDRKMPPSTEKLLSLFSAVLNGLRPKVEPEISTILSAVFPNTYRPNEEVVTLSQPVIQQLPEDKDLLVLLSGGAGSLASLWRVLSSGREPSVLFVEGCHDGFLEKTRRSCVETVMAEGRNHRGGPLATPDLKTWLTAVEAPDGMSKLPRKARIVMMVGMVWELLGGLDLPALVWGSMEEGLLRCLAPWDFTHVVPFPDRTVSLFALAEAEAITDRLCGFHGFEKNTVAPGAMLVKGCTNIVCSCMDNPLDTEEPFVPRTMQESPAPRPFLSMCGRCSGCRPWFDAWTVLCSDIPFIRTGTRQNEKEDDDRRPELLPTVRQEKRIDFELLVDGKNTKTPPPKLLKRQQKKRPMIEEPVEDDDDEDDDVSDAESDGGYESGMFDEEIDELLEEGGYDEDLPEDLFEGYDSDGSDAAPKKRKRKQ